jgi:hypothetical protein
VFKKHSLIFGKAAMGVFEIENRIRDKTALEIYMTYYVG